jgi:16S rRNA processing protein RimM
MRVEPLTDDPERFGRLKTVLVAGQERTIEEFRQRPRDVLLRLDGISTPEQVQALRGEYIRIRAEDAAPLPEGAYYHYQLTGLQVATTAGEPLGELVDVLPLESNDVYVVRGSRGEVLVPALRSVIREVDLEARRMTIEPMPGLLPWEEARE